MILAILVYGSIVAAVPPFSSVKISGTTLEPYNKVSLFERGSSQVPRKTANVEQATKKYSIVVNIPGDMKKRGTYFLTDMRFWKDANNNGIMDEGEPRSQCHFIVWVPGNRKVSLEVYNGPQYEIRSSSFQYDYKGRS